MKNTKEMQMLIEEACQHSKRVRKEWKDYKALANYYVRVVSNNNGYTFEDIYKLACDVLEVGA